MILATIMLKSSSSRVAQGDEVARLLNLAIRDGAASKFAVVLFDEMSKRERKKIEKERASFFFHLLIMAQFNQFYRFEKMVIARRLSFFHRDP